MAPRKQRKESVVERAIGLSVISVEWGGRRYQRAGVPAACTGCEVSETTVYAWIRRRSLPVSEITGASNHAERLEQLTGGKVTRDELIAEVEQRQREQREARHA